MGRQFINIVGEREREEVGESEQGRGSGEADPFTGVQVSCRATTYTVPI